MFLKIAARLLLPLKYKLTCNGKLALELHQGHARSI